MWSGEEGRGYGRNFRLEALVEVDKRSLFTEKRLYDSDGPIEPTPQP
jgi:hypothetical protein